jgi:16S rRNA (cytosine1402-N4)-methyltransferase
MHHLPVLLQEVLYGLHCEQGGVFLDGTVGCGGHATAILEQHPDNRVIGIDRDQAALDVAARELEPFGTRASLYHERFEAFESILSQQFSGDLRPDDAPRMILDGFLLDLGVSSLQLDDPERGFSFQSTARLDMRMNRQESRSAYDIVNTASAEELADLFFQYGEERQSRRIARKIIATRAQAPIETTTQLAELVAQAIPKRFHPQRIHPATRVFQALRIAVNGELEQLQQTVERAILWLKPGGRICIIAFHSLEDRIVKRTFAALAKGCQCPTNFPVCVCGKRPCLTLVSRKPLVATPTEQQSNPRSRSAKLRIAEKI